MDQGLAFNQPLAAVKNLSGLFNSFQGGIQDPEKVFRKELKGVLQTYPGQKENVSCSAIRPPG